jgi:hypothetical protein
MNEENKIEPDFLKRPQKNPFRTPEGYFDSMEDRIMEGIKHNSKPKTTSAKIIRLLKPVFGIAASLLLVALLVYSPIKTRLSNDNSKTEIAQNTSTDLLDSYTFNLGSVDDNVLVNAIFTDESADTSATSNDELLAYLSSDLNEVEIYSEIQNY